MSILLKKNMIKNASVAIQILPSLSNPKEMVAVVDKVIAFIKSTGLPMQVGAFETTIEGEYDQLLNIVKQCGNIAIEAGAPSLMAYVKIHYQPHGNILTIKEKTQKHQE